MGRHGLFPAATGAAHADNETPHVAATLMSLVAFAVPCEIVRHDVALLDAFNYVGTLAAFGFIVPYVLISVAAPAYLKQLGARKPRHLLVSGASLALLVGAGGGQRLSRAAGTGAVFLVLVSDLPRSWRCTAASRKPRRRS
ncbi:MAG: hypothetical protein WBW81_05945 [Methylocella sp.]